METEFDLVARWIEEVVDELGPDYAVPAACRGSASPAALDWLVDACGLGPGHNVIDVGGGMGGPAAYAARSGIRPVVVEPMSSACRAAARLFDLPVVRASGERLPFATGRISAAWCLGVLCTTTEKSALLHELRRVLRIGGPLGLLVFVARTALTYSVPDGNDFPSDADLLDLVDAAGFTVVKRVYALDLPAAPDEWRQRIDRVEETLAEGHRADRRSAEADEQQHRMSRLLESGEVAGVLLHLIAR